MDISILTTHDGKYLITDRETWERFGEAKNEESAMKILSFVESQENRIAALETALRACAARAGNPDPAEGCRQVIRTAQDALERKEGES